MRKRYYWQQWSDEEILGLSLRKLGLRLEGSYVERAAVQLFDELKKKQIMFRPHFWISDEWFCPEGVPGVAIPFYLLHPRLQQLERKFVGALEGSTHPGCMKLLRHETGHAFEVAHRLNCNPKRISAFGSSGNRAYPFSYSPKRVSRNHVVHFGAGYAQSHPDEDFAESFAVLLDPESKWQEKYKEWPVFKKLKALDELILAHRIKPAKVRNRRKPDCIENMNITVGNYLRNKRRKFKIKDQKQVDLKLLEVFEPMVVNQRGRQARIFLRNHGREMISDICATTGQTKSQVAKTVISWQKRSHKMNLVLKYKESSTKRRVLDLLTWESLEDLHQGRDKIIL